MIAKGEPIDKTNFSRLIYSPLIVQAQSTPGTTRDLPPVTSFLPQVAPSGARPVACFCFGDVVNSVERSRGHKRCVVDRVGRRYCEDMEAYVLMLEKSAMVGK